MRIPMGRATTTTMTIHIRTWKVQMAITIRTEQVGSLLVAREREGLV